MLYWLLKYVLVGPFLRLFFKTTVTGVENIPADGPVVIIGNHLSVIDSIFMPLYAPRKVQFLAKSEYFTGKGIKGWLTKMLMVGTGQIPIDRSGGKASEAALNTGLRVLSEGRVLALYPEGTRSPDGIMYRGRTGAARTILAAGCPVVPAAMVNSEKVMPIGSKRLHRVPLEVHFGAPMDFTRFQGMDGDRFVLRSITDEMMHALRNLSGQEYRDVYASGVRARMAARKAQATQAA